LRLHELAKSMEAESKELLALAKKLGLPVKSPSSNLEPGEVGILKAAYKYRDLNEDEILEKLEQAENQKEAEKKTNEAASKIQAEKLAHERAAREAQAKIDAEEAASAADGTDEEAPPDEGEAVEEGDEVGVEEGAPAEEQPAGEGVEETAATAGAPAIDGATVVEPMETGAPVARAGPGAGAPPAPAAPAGSPAVAGPARRGAKILGRIELNKADVAKSEATHAALEKELTPGTAAGRRRGEVVDKEAEAQAQARKRAKAAAKPVKWQAEVEEFAPVSENQVAKPRFWERGPARRQTRTKLKRAPGAPVLQQTKTVRVQLPTSVKELSPLLGLRAGELISKLLTLKGTAIGISQPLDAETVGLIALEFKREIEIATEETAETKLLQKEKTTAEKTVPKKEGDPRPPVVVIMGHVDHGKTSLLDYIRKTKVVDTEHGGITQHMRAYQVTTPKGGRITFLDTPGHRAFTEMRSRGANVTDIVVLVVAADDGVMPQTVESVEHARAANPDMPIVVALNKIDKRDANPLRAKQQLMGLNLLPEEFGGKVGVVECSATTGKGIDDLLDRIELEAEVHDLRAEKKGRAQAFVIEATKEEGKGVVATVLVRSGTLRMREAFLCGRTWGRVRMMEDDVGKRVEEAPPSMPVRLYGFKGDVPEAGDALMVVADEKEAEHVAGERTHAVRAGQVVERPKVTLENLFATLGQQKAKEIPVIIKGDVSGSIEVLKRELDELKHVEVNVKVLRAAVGAITEEDIMLASTSNALVFGFHVVPDAKSRRLAEQLNVEVKTYYVIYELLDDLKKSMAGMLKPEESEKILGHVEVRETFKVSKVGTIAGCFVTDGVVKRSDKVRVLRDGKVIYSTGIETLRRFKDDVKEVKEGFECGLKLANFDDVKKGDTLEAFEIVQKERELKLA
jgi:translation initiation factor IF-2